VSPFVEPVYLVMSEYGETCLTLMSALNQWCDCVEVCSIILPWLTSHSPPPPLLHLPGTAGRRLRPRRPPRGCPPDCEAADRRPLPEGGRHFVLAAKPLPSQRRRLAQHCKAPLAAAATAAVQIRAISLPQSAKGRVLPPPLARVRPPRDPEQAAPARPSLEFAAAVASCRRHFHQGLSPLTLLSRRGQKEAHRWR